MPEIAELRVFERGDGGYRAFVCGDSLGYLPVSALYELINTRLVSGKKTVVNTNLSVEEIRGRYSAQIASRLEGEYEVLRFYGRDIRLQKKELKK